MLPVLLPEAQHSERFGEITFSVFGFQQIRSHSLWKLMEAHHVQANDLRRSCEMCLLEGYPQLPFQLC